MPLDEGFIHKHDSDALARDNQYKREQWYQQTIKDLLEALEEVLDNAIDDYYALQVLAGTIGGSPWVTDDGYTEMDASIDRGASENFGL